MRVQPRARPLVALAIIAACLSGILASAVFLAAQSPAGPRLDEAYTALIRQYLQDPRITTELVDHLPASDTVPSPLAFLGRVVGTPGELTYARDLHRYYNALARSSPRARLWTIGTSEEGREIVALAIADEATIAALDRYKSTLAALTDPRTTTDAQAAQLVSTGKPVYYIVAGMHSTENGGPEMLIELAYRLIVEETPFIQNIRANVITLITPVIEVDGREKQVDTYYFNKQRKPGDARLPLVYSGKYVQHDNNRDGIGQYLRLTQAITALTLDWHPTITHDLHEAQPYLYASTGTGPYNQALDPITIGEWWMLSQNDVMEMTRRSVPGVWTYGYYDGWAPNYMVFIAHSHNAVGRFYEVQGYGPDITDVLPAETALSREWFRPNPPLPVIRWGPRNNTNIQQSALLFSLSHVAKNRQLYLENYWLKNKHAVDKGRDGPTFGWLIPARQRRKADAAAAVNDLRRQGLEISRANAAFRAGDVHVEAGDYIVRGDQPFRTIADMYFSIQNYPPANPAPFDDTGWTYQLLRDIVIQPVTDKAILDPPMTPVTSDVIAPGGIEGTGTWLIVEHTADNNLAAFRFRNPSLPMRATEDDLEIATISGPRTLRAGALVLESADLAAIGQQLATLGLSAWAMSSRPDVGTHDLDVPRIGYVHSWLRTQDEGWWRAAFDANGVPYTYFGDVKLREGKLREKYDVLVLPQIGGSIVSQLAGIPRSGNASLPYKKTASTPNLGSVDWSDDIRGGMGIDGLAELVTFVRQGGLLITEGSTAAIFPEYGVTPTVTLEDSSQLLARGSVVRTRFADPKSPLAYGYAHSDLPVYFNQAPVLNAGRSRATDISPAAQAPAPASAQTIAPNVTRLRILPLEATETPDVPPPSSRRNAADRPDADDRAALVRRLGGLPRTQARVVLEFTPDPGRLLLSGTLAGGEALAGRAAAVDVRLGDGHLVMFAIHPFWRWQTQGTYTLAFNALMNWNDLDAGR